MTTTTLRPSRTDTSLRTTLLVVLSMSALYAIAVLLEIARPRIAGPEQALRHVNEDPVLRLQLELLVIGWLVGSLAWIVTYLLSLAARGQTARRRWRASGAWIALGALVAPYLAATPTIVAGSGAWAVGCAVTTSLGLFLITRLQRFDRMSWWIPVCALGWGALVATGFALGFPSLVSGFLPAYTFTGDVSIAGIDAWRHQVFIGYMITVGFSEELAKAAGIVALCALFRHRLTGVVSGIVIGACAGLGFNFSESLLYLARSEGTADVFQFYGRQGVSLMAAHTSLSPQWSVRASVWPCNSGAESTSWPRSAPDTCSPRVATSRQTSCSATWAFPEGAGYRRTK